MARLSLATTLRYLLVCSIILTPAVGFAEGGYRGSVQSVAEQETQPRQDYERRGREAIDSGDAAMKQKDYEKATAYYKSACDTIPNAPSSHSLYHEALGKFGEASVKLATQRITEGRYGDAESILKVVLDERYDPHCKKAVVILSRLEQPDYYAKTSGSKTKANVEQVKQYFIEAQGFYDSGRYTLAKKRCDQILNLDPYNVAAREFEEKCDRAMDDYGIKAYNETRAKAIAEADGSFFGGRRFDLEPVPVIQTDVSAADMANIRRKLEHIIIPKLEFREVTISEAVDFLKKKSVELDVDSPVGDRGVNIVLKLDGTGGAAAGPGATPVAPAVAIPSVPTADAASPVSSTASGALPAASVLDTRITVFLTNIPLIEALRYVTGLANLKFKVEPNAISIVPLDAATDVLVTKEWKIPRDLIPRLPGAGKAAGGTPAPAAGGAASGAGVAGASKGGAEITDRETAKNWLIANGVVFNGAASAIYIIRSSRLIVRNTQDQLDLVDTIISNTPGGNGPSLVEIECKFVEIQQSNPKELSFDVLRGQHGSFGGKVSARDGTNGASPAVDPADSPFVAPAVGPVGTNPVTAGCRSGGVLSIDATAVDEILLPSKGATGAHSEVFTDPRFRLFMRFVNQKKGVDILSAPKVTVKSGQSAVIEVIREFDNFAIVANRREFVPPQVSRLLDSLAPAEEPASGGGSPSSASLPFGPSSPPSLTNSSVGITLEVKPVVGPDGYTIDLNLTPQVVEFEGSSGYGDPVVWTLTNPITKVSTQYIITPNTINHPIFSTRKATTSVSVFDGSTVVLGGLIREEAPQAGTSPIGDVPIIIGRSAGLDGGLHSKHNLVVFVSARLVDPGNGPVRADDEKEEVIDTTSPPAVALHELLPLVPK